MTELSLAEFLQLGPQKDCSKPWIPLLRKSKDGKLMEWNVEADDSLCTLQEAFELVQPGLGFNIEIKLDDCIVYQEFDIVQTLSSILEVTERLPFKFNVDLHSRSCCNAVVMCCFGRWYTSMLKVGRLYSQRSTLTPRG